MTHTYRCDGCDGVIETVVDGIPTRILEVRLTTVAFAQYPARSPELFRHFCDHDCLTKWVLRLVPEGGPDGQ